MRKSGTEVWEYRFRSKSEQGNPQRQITLSTTQYPTEKKARVALQAQLLKINGAETFKAHNEPTLGVVIDRFIQEERLVQIMAQPPGEVTINGRPRVQHGGGLYQLPGKAHPATVGEDLPKPYQAS